MHKSIYVVMAICMHGCMQYIHTLPHIVSSDKLKDSDIVRENLHTKYFPLTPMLNPPYIIRQINKKA